MKKRFIRFCLFSLAVFALLYGFVFVRSIIPVTVHDEELRLDRASIPQGSNAFDVLQTAGSNLWWQKKQNQELFDLANDTNWDAGLASMMLASNRQALAGWDAATKLPDMQVPEATNFDDPFPYLPVWKELAETARVRENFLLHEGRDQEAFAQIMSQIQMGRRMQNAHGLYIVYLVASAINNLGLSQLRHWAGRTHLDPVQLKACIHQLDADPAEEAAAYGNALKAEYHCEVRTLDALRNGEALDAQEPSLHSRLAPLEPIFNWSQTKEMFARGMIMMVDAAPHHYNEFKMQGMDSKLPGFVSLILSGNAGGQIVFYMAIPALYPSLSKKSQQDVQLQATRTILALRTYQLTHGNLPTNLSALVPEWLDKVPLDDFDGQPLRYSRDRKIIYSVGQNLTDDGGDEGHPPKTKPLDLVYHFDF